MQTVSVCGLGVPGQEQVFAGCAGGGRVPRPLSLSGLLGPVGPAHHRRNTGGTPSLVPSPSLHPALSESVSESLSLPLSVLHSVPPSAHSLRPLPVSACLLAFPHPLYLSLPPSPSQSLSLSTLPPPPLSLLSLSFSLSIMHLLPQRVHTPSLLHTPLPS